MLLKFSSHLESYAPTLINTPIVYNVIWDQMANERYTQEFKIAAVEQITQEGHSIQDVARRFGIPTNSQFINGVQ